MSDILERIKRERIKATKVNVDVDGYRIIYPNVIYLNIADYRELHNHMKSLYGDDCANPTNIYDMRVIKRAGEMECAFVEDDSILSKSADEMNLELLAKQYFESAKKSEEDFKSFFSESNPPVVMKRDFASCKHDIPAVDCKECSVVLNNFNQNVLKPELETIGMTLTDDGVIQRTENSVTMKRTMSLDDAEKYCQGLRERISSNYEKANDLHKRLFSARENDHITPKHLQNFRKFLKDKTAADAPPVCEHGIMEYEMGDDDEIQDSDVLEMMKSQCADAVCEHGIIKINCPRCRTIK